MQAKFFNFSDAPFGHPSLGGTDEHCQWNRSPYFFPPKSEMMMEFGIVEHLAKHLANRELQKEGNQFGGTERDCSPKFPEQNPRFMKAFLMACISVETPKESPHVELADSAKGQASNFIDTEAKNDTKVPFCSQCDSKGVRHKKDCPTLKKTAEDDFQGK